MSERTLYPRAIRVGGIGQFSGEGLRDIDTIRSKNVRLLAAGGYGTGWSSGGNLSPWTMPPNIQEGDVAVFGHMRDGTGGNNGSTTTPPAGWEAVYSASLGTFRQFRFFKKILTGAEASISQIFHQSHQGDYSYHWGVFSGVDPLVPITFTNQEYFSSTGDKADFSVVRNGSLVVTGWGTVGNYSTPGKTSEALVAWDCWENGTVRWDANSGLYYISDLDFGDYPSLIESYGFPDALCTLVLQPST